MSTLAAFVLTAVALGAVAVLVLRRYVPRVASGPPATTGDERDVAGRSEHVVIPSNDATGGRYLDDPARAGWEEPPTSSGDENGDESASDPGSRDPARLVTVPPKAVAPARESLDADDAERAVDRAYHAVREELAARADLAAHETPQEFCDACRTAFDERDLDAVESLVGLYEQVIDGATVSREVVEAVLDRLTDHGERPGDAE